MAGPTVRRWAKIALVGFGVFLIARLAVWLVERL